MSGKGSTPRPYSVDRKTFESNWDNIFKRDNDDSQNNKDTKQKDSEPSQKSRD
jgi:hypothetical protein